MWTVTRSLKYTAGVINALAVKIKAILVELGGNEAICDIVEKLMVEEVG